MLKKLLILATLFNLVACTTNHDPKLAWWVTQSPSGLEKLPAVGKTGVNIQQVYVNGTGYNIVTPAR